MINGTLTFGIMTTKSVSISVADTTRLDLDDRLAGPRVGDDDVLDGDRFALGAGDDSTYDL